MIKPSECNDRQIKFIEAQLEEMLDKVLKEYYCEYPITLRIDNFTKEDSVYKLLVYVKGIPQEIVKKVLTKYSEFWSIYFYSGNRVEICPK